MSWVSTWETGCVFDNVNEAKHYIFDTWRNKGRFYRNVQNNLVYFNDYGLQWGDHNQRNEYYGHQKWGVVTGPSKKIMFQKWKVFLTNVWKKYCNYTTYFKSNGFMALNEIVNVKGIRYYFNLIGKRVLNKHWYRPGNNHSTMMFDTASSGRIIPQRYDHFTHAHWVFKNGTYTRNRCVIVNNILWRFDNYEYRHFVKKVGNKK